MIMIKEKNNNLFKKENHRNTIKFCLMQLCFILLYLALKNIGESHIFVKNIQFGLFVLNELIVVIIFWKFFRRKKIIDKFGRIKKSLYNNLSWLFLKKISLIVLIYLLLHLICQALLQTIFPDFESLRELVKLIVILLLILHFFMELSRVVIMEDVGAYVPLPIIIAFYIAFALFSDSLLNTFFVSTLFVGIVNWLASDDAFIYSQDQINIDSNLKISFNLQSKRRLARIKSGALFFSISFSFARLITDNLLKVQCIKDFLINLVVSIRLVESDAIAAQELYVNSILTLTIVFIFFLSMHLIINYLIRTRISYGIPVISKILNMYEDEIIREFKNIISGYSLTQIRIKKYYLNKVNEYLNSKKKAKIYICFDDNGIFDHYISVKSYKSLADNYRRKYQLTKKNKISKQLDILNEVIGIDD